MIAIQVSSFILSLSFLWTFLSFGQLRKQLADSAVRAGVLNAAAAQSRIARWIGVALLSGGGLLLVLHQDWAAFTFVLLASLGLCACAFSLVQAGRVMWAALVESGCDTRASKRKTLLEAVGLTVGALVLFWMGLF